MRHPIAALAFVAVLVSAAPAAAQVRALAEREESGAGPALAGGSVVWSERAGRVALRVQAQAGGGGPTSVVARPRLPKSAGTLASWSLAGSGAGPAPGRFAVALSGSRPGGLQLVGGPLGGPVDLVAERVASGRSVFGGLFASATGAVTFEGRPGRTRLVVRPAAGQVTRAIPAPGGPQRTPAAVAGDLAALPVLGRRGGLTAVEVIDLQSGAVVRRVDAGRLRTFSVIALGLAPDGGVAITAEDGAGGDVVGSAPAGVPRLGVLLVGDQFGLVQPAGDRVALVRGDPRTDPAGDRVVVLGPGSRPQRPRVVFRGPPTSFVDGLSYDGTSVAWGSKGCQLVAHAVRGSSRSTVPRGPCLRTEVAVGTYVGADGPRREKPRLPIDVACLTAPDRACRVTVRALDFKGRRLGRTAARVRRGRARTLFVGLGRQAAKRAGPDGSRVQYRVRVSDPSGRSRTFSAF